MTAVLETMREYDFDQMFSIMEESFPLGEYRPYPEQKNLLSDPKYRVYVLPEPKSGKTKAFLAVWQFADFAYVEHFAVASECRGQGLGSLALQELKEMSACPLCLEVELPQNDTAKRRIGFYKKNGFFLNEYPYMQPPISKGRKPLPLRIMTSEGPITKDRFETIKAVLYRNVYKTDGS